LRAATWLLTEVDPEDPTTFVYGLCKLGMGEPKIGSVRPSVAAPKWQ